MTPTSTSTSKPAAIGFIAAVIGIIFVFVIDQVGDWVPAFMAIMATSATGAYSRTRPRQHFPRLCVTREDQGSGIPAVLWVELYPSPDDYYVFRIRYLDDSLFLETDMPGVVHYSEHRRTTSVGQSAIRLQIATNHYSLSSSIVVNAARLMIQAWPQAAPDEDLNDRWQS